MKRYLIEYKTNGTTYTTKEPSLKWVNEVVSRVLKYGGIITRIEKIA